jgi:hypothetical protein
MLHSLVFSEEAAIVSGIPASVRWRFAMLAFAEIAGSARDPSPRWRKREDFGMTHRPGFKVGHYDRAHQLDFGLGLL